LSISPISEFSLAVLPDDERALVAAVREFSMLPYYCDRCDLFSYALNESLIAGLAATSAPESDKLRANLNSARDSQSEKDVPLACQALALFSLRIGDYRGRSRKRTHRRSMSSSATKRT
jgi:hypothetical protein